jgi:hypothetical protein
VRTASVLPVVALAFASAGCGPVFFVEVTQKNVCIARLGQSIPAVPLSSGQPVEWSGALELGSDLQDANEKGASGEVHILSVSIDGGATDLSGITVTSFRIADDAGVETEILEYRPAQPVPVPTTRIVATGGDAQDVFAYLDSGTLRYTVELAGTLPPVSWTADVEICMSFTLMVDLMDAARQSR